jgi:hypothetical protein
MGEGSSVESYLREVSKEEDEESDEGTARVGKGWWRLKMVTREGERGGIFRAGGEPSGVSSLKSLDLQLTKVEDSSLTSTIQFTHFPTSPG